MDQIEFNAEDFYKKPTVNEDSISGYVDADSIAVIEVMRKELLERSLVYALSVQNALLKNDKTEALKLTKLFLEVTVDTLRKPIVIE